MIERNCEIHSTYKKESEQLSCCSWFSLVKVFSSDFKNLLKIEPVSDIKVVKNVLSYFLIVENWVDFVFNSEKVFKLFFYLLSWACIVFYGDRVFRKCSKNFFFVENRVCFVFTSEKFLESF